MESKKRSFAKSVIRRIVGIIVLGLITWLYTKNVETTTIVTGLFHSIKFTLDYVHERAWERIDWGLLRKTDLNEEDQEKMMNRLRKLGYLE